ncbi:MAG TPA: glycosyl hydrolase [bacterium]|nr:glycosyl hydrolase [bacterium]
MKGKLLLLLLLTSLTAAQPASPAVPEPVIRKASPEARALLQLLYRLSGQYTLTGQHNYPAIRDTNTQFAATYIGKTPAVFSCDLGFAAAGDKDSFHARPAIVQECIRQHRLGSIITLCWHAVPPTADEPVTFSPIPGANPESLRTVQGQLLDRQFAELLTPGTPLYKKWCAQVDTIAGYLRQLRDAHVPVLWRPYHEMNGSWFWWGGRHSDKGTAALYRQIFDRLTRHHKLNNLLWVWSVDRPHQPAMHFSHYYPGDAFLDLLALDVYGSDFNQGYYDSLVVLAKGKPVTLGEVGQPPSLEILARQPRWAYWVIWAGMVRNTSKKEHRILSRDPRVLSLEDAAYRQAVAPYRSACSLLPLPMPAAAPAHRTDFSGEWLLDEELCDTGGAGFSAVPERIAISQGDAEIVLRQVMVEEIGANRIVTEHLPLDGGELKAFMGEAPRTTTTEWCTCGDTLRVLSRTRFTRGGQELEMTERQSFTLAGAGRRLIIHQQVRSGWGERRMVLVYDQACARP